MRAFFYTIYARIQAACKFDPCRVECDDLKAWWTGDNEAQGDDDDRRDAFFASREGNSSAHVKHTMTDDKRVPLGNVHTAPDKYWLVQYFEPNEP